MTFFLFLPYVFDSLSPTCRCGYSNYLFYIGLPFCTTTLWHTSCRFLFCTNYLGLATMPQWSWLVQYIPLEPAYLQGTFSLLHAQVLEKDKKGRMDVSWWNIIVHNRYIGSRSMFIHVAFYQCLLKSQSFQIIVLLR